MIDTQIGFVGQPLDRADHIRSDAEALEALKDERALLLRLDGLDPVMDDDNRLHWGGLDEAGDAELVFLGLMVGSTGLILDFPLFGQIRQDMQLAHMLHSGGAMLFVALSLAHIYIGTIGMEGALEGMKTGYVDETWAREHHEYWYREARGERIPDNAPRPGHKPSAAH